MTKGRRRKIGKLSRLVPGLEGSRFSHVEGGRLPLNTPGQVIKSLSYGVEEMMFSSWFWCCILILRDNFDMYSVSRS